MRIEKAPEFQYFLFNSQVLTILNIYIQNSILAIAKNKIWKTSQIPFHLVLMKGSQIF